MWCIFFTLLYTMVWLLGYTIYIYVYGHVHICILRCKDLWGDVRCRPIISLAWQAHGHADRVFLQLYLFFLNIYIFQYFTRYPTLVLYDNSFLLLLTIFTTLTILSVYIALVPICVITLWLGSQTTCYNILAMHNILYAWLSIASSLIPYGTDFWG